MATADKNHTVDMLAHYESVWLKCQRYVKKHELDPAIHQLMTVLDQCDSPRNLIVLLDENSDEMTGAAMVDALQVAQQHPQLAELLLCGPERILTALARMLSSNIRCFNETGALFAYLRQPST